MRFYASKHTRILPHAWQRLELRRTFSIAFRNIFTIVPLSALLSSVPRAYSNKSTIRSMPGTVPIQTVRIPELVHIGLISAPGLIGLLCMHVVYTHMMGEGRNAAYFNCIGFPKSFVLDHWMRKWSFLQQQISEHFLFGLMVGSTSVSVATYTWLIRWPVVNCAQRACSYTSLCYRNA